MFILILLFWQASFPDPPARLSSVLEKLNKPIMDEVFKRPMLLKSDQSFEDKDPIELWKEVGDAVGITGKLQR